MCCRGAGLWLLAGTWGCVSLRSSSYEGAASAADIAGLAVPVAHLAADETGLRRPWQPRFLKAKGLRRLQRLLQSPELDFLGAWRSNLTFLGQLNHRLVGGGLALVEDFLAPPVAHQALKDTLRGVGEGWLRPLGTPLENTGLNMSLYAASAAEPPSARCASLYAADSSVGFRFHFHVLG